MQQGQAVSWEVFALYHLMITALPGCVSSITKSSLEFAFLWAAAQSQERNVLNKGLLCKLNYIIRTITKRKKAVPLCSLSADISTYHGIKYLKAGTIQTF